jgi:hypothetical protein
VFIPKIADILRMSIEGAEIIFNELEERGKRGLLEKFIPS